MGAMTVASFKDLCMDAADPEGNEFCAFPPTG
jgi:hypothetical protein